MKQNENSLEFSLKSEMAALGELIASLNRNGIPYTLIKDSVAVRITIHGGY